MLAQRLGEQGLIGAADKAPYERSVRHAGGSAIAVLGPGSEDELAVDRQDALEATLPVVVQGAASGLAGAAMPTPDGRQWALSTPWFHEVQEVGSVNRCA